MAGALAGGRELGDGAARRRLRRLAAGVRVDLGVEDEDVDVATGREDLVEAAEADVVGPAVAADDPDALADEVAGEGEQVSGVGAERRRRRRASASRRRLDPLALEDDLGLGVLDGVEEPADEVRAELRGEALEQPAGVVGLGVEGEPHPEPELGVVLEQRVAPGRAATGGVDRPRRRRQVGAVDRRAAGRVGHDHPVAEELADQPEVGRLAAAAAGARELEQRLQDLAALDRVVRDQARDRAAGSTGRSPSAARSTSRWSATGSMLMALWLVSVLLLAGQTSTQTPQPVQSSGATWIVSRWSSRSRDLNSLWRKSAGARLDRGRREDLHPDRRVRADHRALAAVDADRRDPRSGSSGRSPASRTSSSRSGRCRRPAAR